MQLFTETTEAFNLPTAGCIPCCRNCTQSAGRTALCYTHKYHLYNFTTMSQLTWVSSCSGGEF